MTQPSADLPLSQTTIRPRHFRAPPGDEEALIEPPINQARNVFDLNCGTFNGCQSDAVALDIAGISLLTHRINAHHALVNLANDWTKEYRWYDPNRERANAGVILSGHQSELFHPGVWLKNYVLNQLSSDLDGVSINLVIDNDTAGPASIRLPAGSPSRPHVEELRIDEPYDNVPFEERPVVSPAAVKTFARRLRKQFDPATWFPGLPSPALLADKFADYLELPRSGNVDCPLGEILARARHRLEADYGLQTLELPLSHIAQTASFRTFAIHLFRELPRFREIYNRSLAEYRLVNKIRSSSHPVPALTAEDLSIPELTVDGEWLEAPFWIWTKDNPRRRRLFIRQDRIGDSLSTVAFTDREKIATSIMGPNDDPAPWLQLWRCVEELQGIKIRPRALITTMYARLFLSDLFIHGIGGAKYDELTDAIIRRFFGIEPPAYMTVTGTVRLPIPRPATTAADVRNVKQLIREIRFHPEKFVNDASPAVRESAAQFAVQKQELLRQHQFHFRRAAKEEFRALDDLNRQLALLLTEVEIRLRDELRDLEADAASNKLLGSREFSFVLHPTVTLPEQLKKMAQGSPAH